MRCSSASGSKLTGSIFCAMMISAVRMSPAPKYRMQLRRLAVAAGAAGFLVVAFERLRQVVVHDPAHVRLVDAHAERDGRDDHLRIVANERFLVVAPRVRFEARVVGQGANAIALQPSGELVDTLARQAIDDARTVVAARALEHFRIRRLGLRPHGVVQVGAIEARDVNARLAQRELPHDVLPDAFAWRWL